MKTLHSRLLILGFFMLLSGFKSDRHKFYVGMTTINESRDGSKLECSIKLFRDDLELALTEREGGKVIFSLSEADDKHSSMIDGYMQDHFVLKSDEVIKRTFVGAEIEEEIVWIYIEYTKPTSSFTLKNTCLMEVYTEHVNIVHLKQGDNVQSELLNLSKNQVDFKIN